jgi:PAS domain S-box-containing protein
VVVKAVTVLIVEDREADAALMVRELERHGFALDWSRVETEADYLASLDLPPDLILADYSLPAFDALRALAILRERGQDTPLIVVTGSISEEVAVECIKGGAADYLLKDRLARLGPAVEQALEQLRLREERAQVMAALRESEERYRALFERSMDCVYLHDFEGRMLDANPAALALFGYGADEIKSHSFASLLRPDQIPLALEGAKEVRQEGHLVRPREYWVRRKDGREVLLETQAAAIFSEGVPVAVQGIARDITERRRTERRLREHLAFLQALIDAMPFPVFVKDASGRFQSTNAAFDLFFDVEREEILGKTVFEVSGKELAGIYSEADERLFREGGANAFEGPFLSADAGVREVIIRKATYRQEDGSVGGVVGVIVDITERKKAEEERRRLEAQLQQAQKMEAIGSLAGGVAHDFNNLLQAMLSSAELARAVPGDGERVASAMAELEQHIRRGAALARQLLLFSRREAARPEWLDLNEVVEGARRFLGRLVRDDITFTVELAAQQLPVIADRGKLDQVLMNLVVNACDAMPDGGRLTIRTGPAEAGRVWLSVEDTGTGISQEIRDRIFEPFFTTKMDKGSGLGLSVVHGIVSQHGGAIQVGGREGGGSVFRIELPAAKPEERRAAALPPAAGEEIPQGGGERVLVVEDEEGAREGLVDLLTMLGYRATGVASAEDAGRLPNDPPFDLLLSDILLPGASGADLARGLQARWRRLRVILMSGYTEDEAVRRGVVGGWVRFLQKPFDTKTLAQEVRRALLDE